MSLKKLQAQFQELLTKNPDLRLALQSLRPELNKVVNPDYPIDDIEEKLDADYEQILQDNQKSKVLKVLEKLLIDLLHVAAAKGRLKL